MTEKVLFLYDNKADAGTVSAASEAGALVAANLQDMRLTKVARTTGLSGQWFKSAFASAVYVDTVALWTHNLTLDATVRIRLSNNSDMSAPLYDQTVVAWPSLYGWDEGGWDAYGWDGIDELSDGAELKRFSVWRLGEAYQAAFLQLDITDNANPDGFLEAGRLIAGEGWQPSRNFGFGWVLDWVDPSEQTVMEGGNVFIDQREKYRVLTLPFKYATAGDAMVSYGDMNRIVGHSRDIMVLPYPDESPDRYRTAVYGIPVKGGLGAPKQKGSNLFEFTVKIRELI